MGKALGIGFNIPFEFQFGVGNVPGDVTEGDTTLELLIPPGVSGAFQAWDAKCTAGPGGQDILIDILLNGVSIFAQSPPDMVDLPAASPPSTARVRGSSFASSPVYFDGNLGDCLQGVVRQAGTGPAGQGVTVNLYWQ
jgi:hypothetical protein